MAPETPVTRREWEEHVREDREAHEAVYGLKRVLTGFEAGDPLVVRFDRLEQAASSAKKSGTWLLTTILAGIVTLLGTEVSGCLHPSPTLPPSTPSHP